MKTRGKGQPSNLGRERREHFRVPDQVFLSYEVVPPDRVEDWRAENAAPLPDAFRVASELAELKQRTALLQRQARSEQPRTAEYIATVDQKLDRILQVLLLGEMPGDRLQAVEVDLGADGMGLRTGEPLEVGTYLDIRLVLQTSGAGLRTLGRVARVQPVSGGDCIVGIAFEIQRESDHEMLLHHLLQRQSELIREQHHDGESE